MANYSIQRSEAPNSVTVNEATVNTSTNVSLVGQNFTGYGDEIATNFLQMLENYSSATAPEANPRVPGSNAIPGQLWYDLGNATLKIYDAALSWNEMSPINKGVTESGALRWNDTAGRWQEEERIRITDAGGFIIDAADDGVNAVTFSHTGSNLLVSAAGTTDITFSGLSGDLTVTGGRGLSVENGAGAVAIRHGGTDVNWTHASTTDLVIDGLVAINLNKKATDAFYIDMEEGNDPAFAADAGRGKMWVRNDTPNVLVFTDDAGTDWDLNVAGSSVVNIDDLGDVTVAGTTNAMLYKSAGDWIEAPGLTYSGSNLSATNIGGILEANLISRIAPGIISGVSTITADMNFTGADITLDNADRIYFGTANTTSLTHNGSDLLLNGPGTDSLQVTGFSVTQYNHRVTCQSVASSESLTVVGDANTWATTDSYISFYDSDISEHGLQIGTRAGDGSTSIINARLGQLELYASNTLVFQALSSAQYMFSNGVQSADFHNANSAGASTSLYISDVNGDLYDAGYNSTPLADGVLEDINTGNRTVSNTFIGKFVSRTTSTSRIFTIANVAAIEIGASLLVHNGSGSGTFTIADGSITLEWIDGSGSSPATGNRLLANNSVATLRKKSSTVWQIWGNGIS